MLTYPATIDGLTEEHLGYSTELIRGHRARGRSPWRRLSPRRQALLVLAHLRKNETFAALAAGFGIGIATAWRYVREGGGLLSGQAPSLTEAVWQLAWSGADYAFVDATAVPIDRIRGVRDPAAGWGTGAQARRAAKIKADRYRRARRAGRVNRPPDTLDTSGATPTTDLNRLYYCGKHEHHAVVLQGLVDHQGNLVWISHARPASVRDLPHAQEAGLFQTTADARLKILADLAYTGSGHPHVLTGYRRPPGADLPPNCREANRAHAAIRATAEHGFAPFKQWRIMQRARSSPNHLGTIAKAIHALMTQPG